MNHIFLSLVKLVYLRFEEFFYYETAERGRPFRTVDCLS